MKNCVRWTRVKLSLFGLTIVQYWDNSPLFWVCGARPETSLLARRPQHSHVEHWDEILTEDSILLLLLPRLGESETWEQQQPSLLSIWYLLDTRYLWMTTGLCSALVRGLFSPVRSRPGKKINTGGTGGGRGGRVIYNIYYLTLPGPPEVRFPNYFTVLVCWQSRSCRVACGHFPSF